MSYVLEPQEGVVSTCFNSETPLPWLLPSSNPRWAERFDLMCEEFAWTAPGVSQAQFEEFLGDEVDYTDDDSRLI